MPLFYRLPRILFDTPKPDQPAPGGPAPSPAPAPAPSPSPTADPKDKLIADLTARLDALEGKNKPEDQTLAEKAKKDREAADARAASQKQLEVAIRFDQGSKEWLKTNESLLPKTIAGIFEQAEKSNYASAIDKANEIKVGIVQEFFAQQANLDLLTPGLKSSLEEFQKLTKNEQQARVGQIYEMVFEPTFENLRRAKRTSELAKGHGAHTPSEEAYKKKLMDASKKHYGVRE